MNIFEQVKTPKTQSNTFDLSHDVKMSMDAGFLIPNCVMEALPGDKWHLGTDSLVRMAPMIAPLMHRIDISHHYFFGSPRLVWNNWQNWISNTKVAGAVPAHPYVVIDSSLWVQGGILDYMGFPDPGVGSYQADAIPIALTQVIWNEYFRDENLIPKLYEEGHMDEFLTDGDNSRNPDLFILRRRAWEHDYFTSCLPFAQKGDPVLLPIGSFKDVPVKIDTAFYPGGATVTNTGPGVPPNPSTIFIDANAIIGATVLPDNLYAKTSLLAAQAATLNSLRLAEKLQQWLETAARAGSRYTEVVLGHFGVKSKDSRLQRPEFITGSKSPVVISEVLNTSDTATAPQGNMAGHGVSVDQGISGGYYCSEHGWIIGFTSILPKTAYQQGLHRQFSKFGDYTQKYWPEFANLGEQAVLNNEVFVQAAVPLGTFGYTPHYSEYRFMNNRVAGDFRTSLDFWHWGRIFGTEPALNQQFIECNPDNRIFAVVTGTHHFWSHVLHKVTCNRLMPKFGTPHL